MKLLGFSWLPSAQPNCFPLEDVTSYLCKCPRTPTVLARNVNQRKLRTIPFQRMVLNGYVGRSSSRNYFTATTQSSKNLGSCLVIPPPKNSKPLAIVKFLGGAFIGAVPEVTYGYLIELLANEGFLIVSVPYNVAFYHEQVAKDVYHRYNACLDMILGSGLPDLNLTASELAQLPLYSVGHSNGALLQVLSGSYFCERIPEANVIISFYNRSATEAVPYFEQFGPFVSQIMPIVESSPIYPVAKSASDGWKGLLDVAGAMVSDNDQRTVVSLKKFLDQLPGVFDQVRQGISEFKPTPSENRDLFAKFYNVQRTLLVKFNFDTIDDTDLLEATLRPRVDFIGGKLEKIVLDGTHLTPCVQRPSWRASNLYTPVDAIVQGVNQLLLNDVKVLSGTISRWFRQNEI
ncbi:hypothetical protein Ancab_028946 [Ancistrocladus abbreviatus]